MAKRRGTWAELRQSTRDNYTRAGMSAEAYDRGDKVPIHGLPATATPKVAKRVLDTPKSGPTPKLTSRVVTFKRTRGLRRDSDIGGGRA